MTSFVDRMVGAAKLDTRVYEEVEGDAGATAQAMGVVALSALAAGIGGIRDGYVGFGILSALVGWVVWALLTFVIGTKLLPEPETRANIGEMLRTTGFASSPGVLQVLGILPFVGGLIRLAIALWMLAAMVVAVRQALDYRSVGRAVAVCLIGFIAYVILTSLFWWAR